ncbi:MAG: type II secretion system F family protein [Victivallales bacterium]|nr:type II secretion system F family protein [Victivallales bacterium]
MADSAQKYLIYILVFLIVFIPYILLSFMVNKPKVPLNQEMAKDWPEFYKKFYGLLASGVDGLGDFLVEMQPMKAKKLNNYLIIASMVMDIRLILVAEVLLGVLSPIVFALFGMFVLKNLGAAVALALIGGAIGYMYPSMLIAGAADKRQLQIMRLLPFSIDLIASAMSSGVDFNAAIRYFVSIESKDEPLAMEYSIMLRELELGKTRIEALGEMAQRIQTDAFTSFAAAVMHGFEVGSSIVDTLKIQAEEMRRVRFNIAERKAARAVSSMIFPIAIFIMPAMFLIIGTPVLIKVFASGLGGVMQ